jgi:predicted small secreted protein
MKQNFITKLTLILSLVAVLGMATACRNTAHGVGQDMENAGERIQDTTN